LALFKTQLLKTKTECNRSQLEPTSKMKLLFGITLFLSLLTTGVSLNAIANENVDGSTNSLRAGSRRIQEGSCSSISKFASIEYKLGFCASSSTTCKVENNGLASRAFA
jgi:hypothetical protein